MVRLDLTYHGLNGGVAFQIYRKQRSSRTFRAEMKNRHGGRVPSSDVGSGVRLSCLALASRPAMICARLLTGT